MRRVCLAGMVVVWSMLASACSHTRAPSVPTAADEKALRDAEVALATDWNSRNLDRTVSHYADQASLTLPDSRPARGKEAIRTALRDLLAEKNVSFTLTPVLETTGSVLRLGTYSLTRNNSGAMASTTEKGMYLVFFRKMPDGRWAVWAQITGDSPYSPQPSPADPLPHALVGSLFYSKSPA